MMYHLHETDNWPRSEPSASARLKDQPVLRQGEQAKARWLKPRIMVEVEYRR